MDEDICDNELYDDMMEAYAQGFVLCYGGVCDTEGDEESYPVAEASSESDVIHEFSSSEFPEDIPF